MNDKGEICAVESVIITSKLDCRPSRGPDFEAENRALAVLAQTVGTNPGGLLQQLVEEVMALTRCDSAGISILEPGSEHGVFRWVATTGAWSPYRNGTMLREESPCGEAIARETILLMKHPERVFPALLQAEPGIGEVLLAPFQIDGVAGGTVWAIKHGPDDQFDREDARVLQSLIHFASAAHKSEGRYRALFEAVSHGIAINRLVRDKQGSVVDAQYLELNPAYEEQTGLNRAAATGRLASEIFPLFYRLWLETAERVVATGQSERLEEFVADTGRWFTFNIAPFNGRDLFAVLYEDITDRKRAEVALQESEETLAADLANTELLRELAERLVTEENIGAIYNEILSAAMIIAQGDAGTVQTLDPEAKSLTLLTTRNFPRTINDRFTAVDASSRTACGIVLKTGQRAFVDFADEPDDTGCALLVDAGFQTALAVPLTSRSGKQLGMLNIHWHTAGHRSTERELRFLDLIARQAADLIEQRQAQSVLRESEERFRLIVDTARDYAIFATDREGRIITWPTGAQTVFGWTEAEALGQPSAMAFTPEDRANRVPEEERTKAAASGFAPDVRWHQRKDGRRILIEGSMRSLINERGVMTGFLKIGQDVTERHATERALAESESRFRQFANGTANVLWIRDAATLRMEFASPAFETTYGRACHDMGGTSSLRCWGRMIVREDRKGVFQNIRRVRAGERVDQEFRIRRATDGALRWIHDTGFPLLDGDGGIRAVAGVAADVTETRELADRQDVLVAELQHRTRNLIAVVRSISDKTLRGAASLDDFKVRFRCRLEALARVQGLLSRTTSVEKVSFDDLLRSELAALGADGQGAKVTLDGPDGVPLRSSMVQTLALALHELATNADKYGALSTANPDGRLAVRWHVDPAGDDSPRLHVEWQENGVKMLQAGALPRGGGYGRELIERALPYQLHAQTTYELCDDGVRCTIALPISGQGGAVEYDL
ncbi:PAS domain S-box protein (plasmid) [Paracoccus liaowanqingii]|uniref:histidine kinase n=1 Tax=Paracoccus liaowanqingii TaxID=2560053 RepID=A0A4Y5SSK9_9RHOB|nr:PAS domain S-box protein [Paracoccus liaowanqingii]QDA36490.1 PAS domain S-box protein [Paracoccus liaowanqingii]